MALPSRFVIVEKENRSETRKILRQERNMILRLIFALVLAVGAIVILRRIRQRLSIRNKNRTIESKSTVRCAYCLVYLDKEHALEVGDSYYCSPEHAEKGSQNHS